MIEALTILVCAFLVLIAIQDVKSRAVSVLIFPGLLAGALALFYVQSGDWSSLVMNLLFITVLMAALFAYVSVKNRRLTNIINHYFGLGDVLFLICITPLFSSRNLILYVILGMVFALVLHLVAARRNDKDVQEVTVPLAGYLSIFLIGIFIADYCIHVPLFYTDLI